jgi:hypothetical protein
VHLFVDQKRQRTFRSTPASTRPKQTGQITLVRHCLFKYFSNYSKLSLLFFENLDQQKVYNELGADILENSMSGYNACIFAYGQTGSGKSWTMMGGSGNNNKGLTPRLCEAIFDRINAQNSSSEHVSFKVEVSYMEIYNEKVRDLLDPSGYVPTNKKIYEMSNYHFMFFDRVKQNLKVREHKLLGPYVDGLSQLAVSSYKVRIQRKKADYILNGIFYYHKINKKTIFF